MTDEKTCFICGNASKIDERFYMTANEWVWWKVNVEKIPMDQTLIRVNEYGNEFPYKRFCSICFERLCQIFKSV